MHLQQRTLNFVFFVYFAAVLCLLSLPIILARSAENSNSELHENGLSGGSGGGSKMNNIFNSEHVSAYYTPKHNLRSMLLAPKDYQQKPHAKLPLNLDLMDFLLEYEDEERSKRVDDYGHMRFGKRGGEEQFDDYGHMRFGRSA